MNAGGSVVGFQFKGNMAAIPSSSDDGDIRGRPRVSSTTIHPDFQVLTGDQNWTCVYFLNVLSVKKKKSTLYVKNKAVKDTYP
jgi:hypothetical protein